MQTATPSKQSNTSQSRVEALRRNAYLSERGIEPGTPIQLDMLFPMMARSDLRTIPNDCARSALFTARSKSEPRRTFMRKILFHYNQHITLVYTGTELRAYDDEVVFLQIIAYGSKVPVGSPFEFEITDLLKDIGWPRNGRYYEKVRECITRLKANEVLFNNSKAYGSSGSISLIQDYTAINDENGKATRYQVKIHPGLVTLYAGNTFTSHSWKKFLNLTPMGKRLANYVESHRQPYPLELETFKRLCDSENKSGASFRQKVRRTCAELVSKGIVDVAILSEDDKICCVKNGERELVQ